MGRVRVLISLCTDMHGSPRWRRRRAPRDESDCFPTALVSVIRTIPPTHPHCVKWAWFRCVAARLWHMEDEYLYVVVDLLYSSRAQSDCFALDLETQPRRKDRITQ